MAVKEILGVEPGGFAVLVISAIVLILGVPVAARLGQQPTAIFKRTGILYGLGLVGILALGVLIVGWKS